MSEDNKTKFGNMPLGMINKMLVSFIGEDAFLDYCEKYHKDWKLDWQSREAFRKHLDRLFEEKESSYRDLNPHYEQSVYRIAFKILDDFCEQYGLSPYIFNIIAKIGCNLIARLCHSSAHVFETYYILLYEICQNVLPTLLEKAVDEIGKNNGFSYFDAERKYNMAFNELGRQFESLEKFYTKLSEHLWDSPTSTWYKDWYKESYKQRYEKRYKEMHKEKWKKKLDEKINNKLDWKDCLRLHFKDIVIYNCKKGQNPTQWNDMKAILEFCKKEDKKTEMSCLIEAYLTANMENFIKAEIPDSTLKKMEDCLKKISDLFKSVANWENLQNLYDSADRLLYEMEPTIFTNLNLSEDNFKPIDSALSEILINHIYLQDEKRAEDLISNTSGFYCNWLLAYIAVAKGEFEIAKKFYKAAFDNIHFAGIWTEPFLKQAFVLSVFCDSNPDTVRNSIDPEKPSQTPLPKDAKRFAEYGYAIGVFDAPAEDAYLEYLHREEYFNKIFPPEMRFSKIKISSRGMQPNVFICGDIKEMVEKEYMQLSKLDKKNINKQFLMLDAKGGQRRPPLSEAIMMFSYRSDTRFLDLVEKWLGLVDPKTEIKELSFNIVSDFGETPFNAATMVYREFCLNNNDPDAPEKKRLKKITTHILDKTNKKYLGIITKRRFVHPLHNLIDSGDTELVRKTLEKFVEYGLDIDNEKNPNRYRNRDGKWENLKSPNTFLHRCIEHEAWNILKMFLTDFKDKAEKTIKEYSNSEYEPLAFFKAKNKEKREGFIDKFTKLFESCGANFTINSADELKKQP